MVLFKVSSLPTKFNPLKFRSLPEFTVSHKTGSVSCPCIKRGLQGFQRIVHPFTEEQQKNNSCSSVVLQ